MPVSISDVGWFLLPENTCCHGCWDPCLRAAWRWRCTRSSRSSATQRCWLSCSRSLNRWMSLTSSWKIHSLRASGEPTRFFICQMPSVRAIQTILIICVLDLTFEGSFKCVKLPSRRWRVQQAPFTLARRQVRADLKQRMIFLKLYWQAYIPRIKGLCFDLRTGSVARTHLLEHNSYWSDRNKDVRKFVREKTCFLTDIGCWILYDFVKSLVILQILTFFWSGAVNAFPAILPAFYKNYIRTSWDTCCYVLLYSLQFSVCISFSDERSWRLFHQ